MIDSKPFTPGRALALAVLLCITGPVLAADSADSVQTLSGVVSGEELTDGIQVFRGIPYAAPPTGDLRWQPPQPVAVWEGTRDATQFGAICPQPPTLAQMTAEALPASREDCLFLNVWTPATNPYVPLPVMVWIHGGGLSLGWSNQAVYDGMDFAKQGIVLVSINYRLGPLGYLAHPELSAESDHGASGNYGFLDQLAALGWVRQNIAAFGGDPKRVTIFGESAGATSVFALLASPLSDGLFHGAIAQSPWVTPTNVALQSEPTPFARSGEAQGIAFAEHVIGKGATLADLRALDAGAMIAKGGFNPIITADGWFMAELPEARFAADKQQDVPIIVGTNTNEGTMFMAPMVGSLEAFQADIEATYGDQSAAVLAMYPAASKADLPTAADRYITDTWFLRAARSMLIHSADSASPAYQYQFTRRSQAIPAWGAHHAAELGYVFGNLVGFGPRTAPPSAEDVALSKAMNTYWSQFARTGNPNSEGLPAWPAFVPGTEQYLELGDTIKTGAQLEKANCDALEAIIANAG